MVRPGFMQPCSSVHQGGTPQSMTTTRSPPVTPTWAAVEHQHLRVIQGWPCTRVQPLSLYHQHISQFKSTSLDGVLPSCYGYTHRQQRFNSLKSRVVQPEPSLRQAGSELTRAVNFATRDHVLRPLFTGRFDQILQRQPSAITFSVQLAASHRNVHFRGSVNHSPD